MAAARARSAIRSMGLENVRFAMRSILVQRLRSFLTLLGIVSGVATVIAMVSFVAGFNDAITGAFSSFGTTLVQYQKYEPRFGGGPTGPPEEQRKRRDLTLEDAQALKRLNTLAAAVSPERYLNLPGLAASTTFKNRKGKEANGPTLAGVVPDYAPANNASITDGRFFGDADVSHSARTAVVGPDVADALWFHRDPINQELLINGVAFRVIGLLEKRGSFLGGSADNIVCIPFSTFDEMFPDVKNSNGDTIHIATIPRDPKEQQAMTDQGISILRTRRGLKAKEPNDFAIFTSEGQLETFRAITGGIAGAMILIAGIALLVGGVGVMNIMLVSVTERTREIGVRKALGATRKDIAMQFLVEAITLTGVGGAIGIAVGLGIAMLVRLVFDFPAAAPLWSIALGFGVSTAVGLIFGLWPALKAAKQDPIEALRYE
ncbi:MAG: ABC transporter permease [Geothrix sp.]|uniref:ABC transporter permease n=1 Tax=Geothrix sp. TaxID=1962974 RepID=UPI0018238CFE|nr:ABC transporter permease [Geothrix sp.]NWJ42215.1 ABC transporter permease [Geothrix sp.]WIL19822.1 MAG: ABC transporter permease [Geothrix sp.]